MKYQIYSGGIFYGIVEAEDEDEAYRELMAHNHNASAYNSIRDRSLVTIEEDHDEDSTVTGILDNWWLRKYDPIR